MITFKLPARYPLTPELLNEFVLLNADLKISADNGNMLIVEENAFKFDDVEWVELLFPAAIFEDCNFDELYEINSEEEYRLNFEQSGYHSILFKMGTLYTIGLITGAIFASLYLWAKKRNSGRVLPENCEYHLNKDKKPHKKGGVKMADVSYISYEKASEEEQKSWKGRALKAPTLSIEVVSAKASLKEALRKMKNVWMRHGTDIGVVVDPFSKKYFVFEKGKASYKEYSIYKIFTHPLLPDYEGDFSQHVNEIE